MRRLLRAVSRRKRSKPLADRSLADQVCEFAMGCDVGLRNELHRLSGMIADEEFRRKEREK
jgi:hypothetical protein